MHFPPVRVQPRAQRAQGAQGRKQENMYNAEDVWLTFGRNSVARELTLDAAQSARSSRNPSSAVKNLPVPQIKRLLDSRNEREVLDGLRKVISMMYRSQPCLPFFSSVVKNVASPNIEIKKLVYIYLLNHAEQEPDLALLSINTIQKSLSDGNPQVRALALKTMSGIRVPVISQIVSLAIKKGLGDMSPYVRKAAALAIPKCYRLDPNTLPQLLDYLSTLLGDRQYYVAGAAVKAFLEICPDRIDLIHKHYRSLVKKLVDMDEWSQLATMSLMTVYARKCFPRKTRSVKKSNGNKDFYGEEEEQQDTGEVVAVLDPDLELLLKSIRPLFQSRNSAVVVAVTCCYVNLGTSEYIKFAIGPLIALLRGPQDIQHIALYNIVSVCLMQPEAFVKYASHFLVRSTDPPHVWELKLELLTLIFPHCGPDVKSLVLNELEHFSSGSDKDLVREAVRAIGRCAQSDARTSARCLRLLLKQITSLDGNLVAESLTVIRHLIQQDPGAHKNTVIRLAKNLDTATNPRARATIIWLVGEFSGIDGENNVAPDVLRILAKGFADEAEPAKLQIVLLAAKVYLHHLNRTELEPPPKPTPSPSNGYLDEVSNEGFAEFDSPSQIAHTLPEPEPDHPIVLLWNYILLLARYDTSYDLRDRTRLYKALLAVPSSTQLASLMLLAPKPVPHTPSPSEGRTGFTLGSASLVVGEDGGMHGLRGYESLPAWVESGQEPDPSLREGDISKQEYDEKRVLTASERIDSAMKDSRSANPLDAISKNNGPSSGGGKMALDDWLAEGEDNDEDDEDEDDDEEEDDDDEDEDSEETEEESDDETSDAADEESEEGDEEHDRLVK
ncbi:ap-3 adaptor complex subunit beta [Phlyctema vagabunda]|uniref:Ap-3 adaptor complex subunit beta n=1 Tax=Phlyctema vagabunda TaxID=108571 RepID=A0ABR4PVK3_9HELO